MIEELRCWTWLWKLSSQSIWKITERLTRIPDRRNNSVSVWRSQRNQDTKKAGTTENLNHHLRWSHFHLWNYCQVLSSRKDNVDHDNSFRNNFSETGRMTGNLESVIFHRSVDLISVTHSNESTSTDLERFVTFPWLEWQVLLRGLWSVFSKLILHDAVSFVSSTRKDTADSLDHLYNASDRYRGWSDFTIASSYVSDRLQISIRWTVFFVRHDGYRSRRIFYIWSINEIYLSFSSNLKSNKSLKYF